MFEHPVAHYEHLMLVIIVHTHTKSEAWLSVIICLWENLLFFKVRVLILMARPKTQLSTTRKWPLYSPPAPPPPCSFHWTTDWFGRPCPDLVRQEPPVPWLPHLRHALPVPKGRRRPPSAPPPKGRGGQTWGGPGDEAAGQFQGADHEQEVSAGVCAHAGEPGHILSAGQSQCGVSSHGGLSEWPGLCHRVSHMAHVQIYSRFPQC